MKFLVYRLILPRARLGSIWKVDRRGIGPKGHVRTFVYNQNQTILCRSSRAERKIFQKIWSLYNVGNGLYRVFTTAKRVLSFQQKIQEILFSFFKWDTLAQKKGHFFNF